MNIKEQIRDFVAENFLFSNNGFNLADDASFLDTGVIDSTGTLELVMFVEETFDVIVEDDEIEPDNLDSVDSLFSFIQRKTQ
jgi:acyl carrier protein